MSFFISARKQRATPFFAFLLLVFSADSVAQNANSCLPVAQQNDGAYLATLRESEALIASGIQLRSKLLPKADLSARVLSNNGDFSTAGKSYERRFSGSELNIRASQILYSAEAWASYKQAGTQEELAQSISSNALQDLAIRVGNARLEYFSAVEDLALLEAQRLMTRDQLEISSQKYEAGLVPVTEVLEASSRAKLMESQILAARGEALAKKDALNVLCAGSEESVSQLADLKEGASGISLDEWLLTMRSQSPELRRLALTVQLAEQDLQRGEAEYGPLVEAVLNFGLSSNPRGVIDSIADRRTRNTAVGIQLTVPLFSGFATEGKVRELTARKQRAEALFLQKAQDLEVQIRSSFALLEAAKSQLASLTSAISTAERTVEANQTGYINGLRVNFDVLNAQNQLFQARHQETVARFTVRKSLLNLKRSAGILDTNSVF